MLVTLYSLHMYNTGFGTRVHHVGSTVPVAQELQGRGLPRAWGLEFNGFLRLPLYIGLVVFML